MSRISIVNPNNPAAPRWNVRCKTLGKYGGLVAEQDYSIDTKTKMRLVLVQGSTITWRSLEPDVVQLDIPACKFGVLQLSHYQNKVAATMHNTSWTDGGGMFLLQRDPFISLQMCVVARPWTPWLQSLERFLRSCCF